MKKPVYSFCFGNQRDSLSSKIFTETLKVFLLAEIAKMFKEIVELVRFLHRISLSTHQVTMNLKYKQEA